MNTTFLAVGCGVAVMLAISLAGWALSKVRLSEGAALAIMVGVVVIGWVLVKLAIEAWAPDSIGYWRG